MYFICIMTRNCQNQIKTCFKRTMLVQIMFLLCYFDLEQLCRYRTKFDFWIKSLSGWPVRYGAVPQSLTTRVEGLANFFWIKTFEIFFKKTWKIRYSICNNIWAGNYRGLALKNLNRYSNIFEKDSFLFVMSIWFKIRKNR